jgi:hypothetical protein
MKRFSFSNVTFEKVRSKVSSKIYQYFWQFSHLFKNTTKKTSVNSSAWQCWHLSETLDLNRPYSLPESYWHHHSAQQWSSFQKHCKTWVATSGLWEARLSSGEWPFLKCGAHRLLHPAGNEPWDPGTDNSKAFFKWEINADWKSWSQINTLIRTTVRTKYFSCSILLCTTTTCFGPDRWPSSPQLDLQNKVSNKHLLRGLQITPYGMTRRARHPSSSTSHK